MDATDLEVLAPEPVLVQADGETIEVLPLTIGQVPRLARVFKGVQLDFSDIRGLLEEHGERLIQGVAICVDRPVEWAEKLSADEFIELASAVLVVNTPFFAQRVLPALNRLMKTLVDGFGSSSGSSPTATG